MTIRDFVDNNFFNFNSRELRDAARQWEAHKLAGNRMMVTLAGAMSTARLGRLLARLIRAGFVDAVSCTGANLEEDAFNLLAGEEYENIPDWRSLSATDEAALLARGMNRVTDTCIPETVMRHVEAQLLAGWKASDESGSPKMPSEHLISVITDDEVRSHHQRPEESWLLAAAECGVPVYTPGWEDSTTGNMFTAAVFRGELSGHHAVSSGTAQFEHLLRWYQRQTAGDQTVGFFQIGGGIAGDFAICAVPTLVQDLLKTDTPLWSYFCQISDAPTSYGGYSGAVPNEKITWGKLGVDTPRFLIESDATIVAPLIFSYLLGD